MNIHLYKYRIWKATGLTTNCPVHHAFLDIFSLLSMHDYDVEVPYKLFHDLLRSKTQDNDFLFLFLNFKTVFRIQLQKHLLIFDELNGKEFISTMKSEAAQIHFVSEIS